MRTAEKNSSMVKEEIMKEFDAPEPPVLKVTETPKLEGKNHT